MKATATAVGFFGVLRQPGEEFEVPDDTKPASWFELEEKAEDKKPGKRTGKNQPAEGNGKNQPAEGNGDADDATGTGAAE